MSQETLLQPTQDITFSIVVLFYPYKEDPDPLPPNYKYMLLDSGLLDFRVSNNDTLQYKVELNKHLAKKAQIDSWIVSCFRSSAEILHR